MDTSCLKNLYMIMNFISHSDIDTVELISSYINEYVLKFKSLKSVKNNKEHFVVINRIKMIFYKEYYDNIKIETTYVNGKKNGYYEEYQYNGQIYVNSTYENGIKIQI